MINNNLIRDFFNEFVVRKLTRARTTNSIKYILKIILCYMINNIFVFNTCQLFFPFCILNLNNSTIGSFF